MATLRGTLPLQKALFPGVALNNGSLPENHSVLIGLPSTLMFADVSISVNNRA